MALVSGLGVGDGEASPLRLQLLVDYLSGLLGGDQERAVVGRIARVVVAGGLLKSNSALSQPTAYSSVRQQSAAVGPVRWVSYRRVGHRHGGGDALAGLSCCYS